MSLSDRIAAGVKATLGANVVDAVANGLLMLVLTRYLLSPTEFGLLHYALSIIGVVAILGTLGLPSSAARYVTELSETDPDQVRYVVRFGLVAILGLSIVVGTGLALASPLIGTLADEPGLVPLLVLGLGYILGNSLYKLLNKLFQAINRVDWSARIKALSGVARLAGAVLFVLAGFGATGALAGYLVGFAVASAVGIVAFYRLSYTTLPTPEAVESGLKRRILEYSVPLTATRGANVLDKRIDTVLVGLFLGPVAVGYYTVARQVSKFASIPATSLGYTISPTVGEQYADEDLARARRVYETSLRHVLLMYVPAAVGLVLVAEPTVTHVFGSDYADAAPVLQILSGYMLVNAINKVTSDGLDYLGRARSRAIVKSVTATANFLLNLALIPALGVVGAAVATVITYTVYTVTNVYIIHDELGLDLTAIARLLVGVAAVAAVMGGVVRLLVPQVTGIPTLLVVVGAGVAVWAVLSTLSGLLDVARIRRVLT